MRVLHPGLLTALLLLLLLPRLAAQDEASVLFSADPEETVLVLSSEGGYGPRLYPRLTLYANGRLVKESGVETFEAELPFAELEELVLLLARRGVLELDVEALEQEVVRRAGTRPTEFIHDGGYTTLSVSLARYRRGELVHEPFEKTIRCYEPGALYVLYPDLEELGAIMELYRILYKHPRLRKVEGDR